MFTIYFIRKLGDAPIEQRQSDAKDVMDAVKEAEQVIEDAVEAGMLREPELGFTIRDASGVHVGTWFQGRQVGPLSSRFGQAP
jgi:hypothetical protein